jgi:hypothetical protein
MRQPILVALVLSALTLAFPTTDTTANSLSHNQPRREHITSEAPKPLSNHNDADRRVSYSHTPRTRESPPPPSWEPEADPPHAMHNPRDGQQSPSPAPVWMPESDSPMPMHHPRQDQAPVSSDVSETSPSKPGYATRSAISGVLAQLHILHAESQGTQDEDAQPSLSGEYQVDMRELHQHGRRYQNADYGTNSTSGSNTTSSSSTADQTPSDGERKARRWSLEM